MTAAYAKGRDKIRVHAKTIRIGAPVYQRTRLRSSGKHYNLTAQRAHIELTLSTELDKLNPARYNNARFLRSAPSPHQAPPDQGLEVAFAGRSNAGKSSALNTLTGRRALARTSKTPGRTQHLVFFELDPQRRLVDLPGYGYAKVPDAMKQRWGHAMQRYLSERKSLRGLILLMDIRHPLTEFDQQLLHWCRHASMPVHILLTKADKLKQGPAKNTLLKVQRELADHANVSVQLFSARKRSGVGHALAVLDTWLGYRSKIEQKKPPE